MSFEEAIALQPLWVQYWVNFMGLVLVVSFVTFLFSKVTWRDAFILVITTIPMALFMQWLYDQLGYVRLLGLPHVLIWTPLAIYLWFRLGNRDIRMPFRQVMWLLLATIIASLAFDYVDVARYLLGERAPMIPAG